MTDRSDRTISTRPSPINKPPRPDRKLHGSSPEPSRKRIQAAGQVSHVTPQFSVRIRLHDLNDRELVVDTPSPDGRRKQTRRRGFKTKGAVQEALTEILADLQRGVYVRPDDSSVASFVDAWVTAIEPTLRPASHYGYARNMRLHVVPYIGHLKLQQIDAGVLNNLYAGLLREGNRARDGGLSARTVGYVHTILHRAFKDAVKWGRISRNPCDAADPPRSSSTARNQFVTWSPAVLNQFLTSAANTNDRYLAAWELLATTGMRRAVCGGLINEYRPAA